MNEVRESIPEMQRFLDIKLYRTAGLIAYKIRKAMADKDAQYSLAGLVESMLRFLVQRERSGDEELKERARSFAQYLFIETVEDRNIQVLPIRKKWTMLRRGQSWIFFIDSDLDTRPKKDRIF